MLTIGQLKKLHENLDSIHANAPERINAFCGKVEKLSLFQQNLLIDLLGQFTNCTYTTLPEYYRRAYNTINPEMLDNALRIVFAPLEYASLSKGDVEPKSGMIFCRILQGLIFNFPINNKDKIIFYPTCKDLFKNYTKGDLVILIDDFIGTGTTIQDTFEAMINYSEKESLSLPSFDSLLVMAAIGMKRGVDFCIKTLRIPCSVGYVQDKMISRNPRYSDVEIANNLKLMREIENKLYPKMNKKYSLGYMQSESLVNIMDKCPNNTFPFYWYGKPPKSVFVRKY